MWPFIALFALSFVAMYVLMPKPQSAPPPAIGEIKAPTAEEGREIPVLFGTRDLTGPNVVWCGDIKVDPIRKKGGKK